VVEQPFVKANEKTDLNMVKAFLENNGFINKKNSTRIVFPNQSAAFG
jgi:hypothetical protein